MDEVPTRRGDPDEPVCRNPMLLAGLLERRKPWNWHCRREGRDDILIIDHPAVEDP